MKTTSSFRSTRSPGIAVSTLLVGLLGTACQDAETHELGFTQSSRPLSGEEPGESTEHFFTSLADFVGRWRGEAEAALPLVLDDDDRAPIYRFPSGSTAFALALAQAEDRYGNPVIAGTLTFGAGTPPPPATDPELGYPVGVNYSALLSYDHEDAGIANNLDSRFPPFEGFPYSVEARPSAPSRADSDLTFPGVNDGVLALRFNTSEIIDGWCQLQTPILNQYGAYQILPAGLGSFETHGDGTNAPCKLFGEYTNDCGPHVDLSSPESFACFGDAPVVGEASCDKTALSSYCECTAESCRALDIPDGGASTSSLLVRRIGDRLLGVFQNEVFVNARNLTVPMGQATFTRLPD
jgi:hypothetical protein